MSKPAILVLGNCIVARHFDVLQLFPGLTGSFDLGLCKFGVPDPPEELFRRCTLLLAQNRLFGAPTLTPALRDRLPPDCAILRIPTLTFGSLWPLICRDPRDRLETQPTLRYLFPESHADRLALDVMRRVEGRDARRKSYLATDLAGVVDLLRLHEIQAEQLVANEMDCDVRIASYVLSHFRNERLFFAHHHPTPALILYQFAQIVTHPTFAPFRDGSIVSMIATAAAWLDRTQPFSNEQVPIHPQVARTFGLEWWTEDMIYEIDDGRFTFEQWLDHYMSTPLP